MPDFYYCSPLFCGKLESRVTGNTPWSVLLNVAFEWGVLSRCVPYYKRKERKWKFKGKDTHLIYIAYCNFAIASLRSLVSSCCWFALHRPQYRQCGPVCSIISQAVLAHLIWDRELRRSFFLSSNVIVVDLCVKKPCSSTDSPPVWLCALFELSMGVGKRVEFLEL